jgi:hypothetical protein
VAALLLAPLAFPFCLFPAALLLAAAFFARGSPLGFRFLLCPIVFGPSAPVARNGSLGFPRRGVFAV